MPALRFEVMKLWIPLSLHYRNNKKEGSLKTDLYDSIREPSDYDETLKAWEKANELSNEGWELIGSVRITAYRFPSMEEWSRYSCPRDLACSYTSGYELLFRRIIENH